MFTFGSSSNNLRFDCEFDGISEAHTYGEKEFIEKNNQNSCQSLNYSDHQVPAAFFHLMVLSSKLIVPTVKFDVEIFMEESESALMD